MTAPFRRLSLPILAILLTVFTGCGDNRPDRVPVSGRVTIDGTPLTYGHVRLVPDNARPSGGRLDAQGRFTLTCYDGQDGAVPGHHRIEVSAGEMQGSKMHWHAPKKYNSLATSGLDTTIGGPIDDLEIKLTWDGGKPFDEEVEQE